MLDYLRSELQAVRRAPAVFIVAMIAVGGVVLLAARAHFTVEIARLNATIRTQQQELKSAPGAFRADSGPHPLTAREKNFLVRVLSQAPVRATVYLIEPTGDPQSGKSARDLNQALSQAGWQAHAGDPPNLVPVITAPFWRSLPGFVLFVNDKDNTPGATFLANAMRAAGLSVRWGGDPRLPANTCELVIGARS